MVGIYLGEVVDSDLVSDGRWCAAVPGYYKFKYLDSKITDDWPWKYILPTKQLEGFSTQVGKHPNPNQTSKTPEVRAHPPARLEQT